MKQVFLVNVPVERLQRKILQLMTLTVRGIFFPLPAGIYPIRATALTFSLKMFHRNIFKGYIF
ncbi:MAG: hypothetical protein ACI4JQ_04780, partial [Ruminococcus sp.]